MENKNICSNCIDKYNLFNEEPPCNKCKHDFASGKELYSENVITLEIWSLVYNQVLMSFDGAIDINISTVIDTINLFEVDDKLTTLKTIVECWRYFNNKLREKKKQTDIVKQKPEQKKSFKGK
jgi:hypothetical protein